mmetsp:Transcript_6833/g.6137  ORF Transcript_6833/g.6137 Transcript_6833/m.6137 type:complete len:352 (+) Transcript_6833:34-1089(+)
MADFSVDHPIYNEANQSQYKLLPKITISDNKSEIFCVKFSPDGKFLAAGCGDGAIRVFNVNNGTIAYNLQGGSNIALPTTAIKFRPVTATTRTKNVFISANAAGSVQHWHMTSGKCLHSIEDENNQVYALDYNDEGTNFVTGGKDKALRVYDEATKTLISTLCGGMYFTNKETAGHSNRIFSCKFKPGDANIIISGGWDNTVQIWDLRVGESVKSFYGPHICGDSLDIFENDIVTGSWRPDKQLEIWDFATCKKVADIPWTVSQFNQTNSPACMLYAAQFSKEGKGKFIAAGGSGANEAKVFDHSNNNTVVGTVTGLSRGIFTIDFSAENNKIAIGGGDSSIRILDIVSRE